MIAGAKEDFTVGKQGLARVHLLFVGKVDDLLGVRPDDELRISADVEQHVLEASHPGAASFDTHRFVHINLDTDPEWMIEQWSVGVNRQERLRIDGLSGCRTDEEGREKKHERACNGKNRPGGIEQGTSTNPNEDSEPNEGDGRNPNGNHHSPESLSGEHSRENEILGISHLTNGHFTSWRFHQPRECSERDEHQSD
jgi:hypothetical protein